MVEQEHNKFPKIARLSKDMIITEKLDGTNAQITITEDGQFLTGSRNRWIIPGDDNYGFSKWAHENKEELMKLGVGTHFGEWWGQGIQRGYGLTEKRFSLFNVNRWSDPEFRPRCCDIVPFIVMCEFDTQLIEAEMELLLRHGSLAAPGFMDPEGLIIYHRGSGTLYKKTFNDYHKGEI